ncbi:unnamed protein product [Phyllotreta striolata]|uniref:Coiled-coil domain-containing protein 134 n=1 Tax=Phyllotreta striolata TaxID=444603 RepID=A0A9N9TI32_PHYSR|nr:unnamed protein product [Phyllotreta striolata]
MFDFKIFWLLCFSLYILPSLSDEDKRENELAEELYKKLFKQQRVQQLSAIKNFQKSSSYEKQYQMITLMAERIFDNILESRVLIEASPFIPGVSDFPTDVEIRDALSNILENTALFSDIVLRFPEISASLLRQNNSWDLVLQWGIAFCDQMKYLLDASTIKLLKLVNQELNYVDRDPNYTNPYKKAPTKTEEKLESKQKKKKVIKKGPKLSNHFEL